MDKQKEIKKEKKRLNDIFKDIDANKLKFVEHQIENLAWLNVSIEELKKLIDEEGTTAVYNNGGGQSGVRDNPNVKTLIAYQKNVITITKQLMELVPAKQNSRLDEFLNG
jgi:hypothetical protein